MYESVEVSMWLCPGVSQEWMCGCVHMTLAIHSLPIVHACGSSAQTP